MTFKAKSASCPLCDIDALSTQQRSDLVAVAARLSRLANQKNAAARGGQMAMLVAMRELMATSGMGKVAARAGCTREGLHGITSAKGNPRLSNLLAVLQAIGLRMELMPQRLAAQNGELAAKQRRPQKR